MAKRVTILGATGSIGSGAADVVRSHPDALRAVAVSAFSSREKCEAVARELGAKAYCGEGAAERAVAENDADVCLVAIAGIAGLSPTLAAIEKGMDVALATKEVLVMAGGLVMDAARRKGVRIIPVDSEHSAIYQCLGGRTECGREVAKLTLTASGGPFLDSPEDLSGVTAADALRHPSWKMGRKVTVDSATMMNKGFEIIEASWLFGVPLDRIDAVVHPESVVHSLVTFTDGATLAQLSRPDMRIAIQYALTGPDRLASERQALDLASLGRLTFRRPDPARFPALSLAREAAAAGGCAPAVLAAADEWAVARFLEGRLSFDGIARTVRGCVEVAPDAPCDSLEAVSGACEWTFRRLGGEKCGRAA